MKYLLLCIPVIILLLSPIGAAEREWNDPNSLPIWLTEEEKTRLHEIGQGFEKTAPPPGDIRAVAEWETAIGVIIRYPLGIPVSLVKEMAGDAIVYTIVSSSYYQSQATTTFSNAGVNMANIEFIIASTNSYWTRDYGPWFIFDGNNDLGIVDHIYNRPRPLDDAIPGTLGSEWGMPVYAMPLVTTGGNHMTNGWGVSMSTELVYDENSISNSAVDAVMDEYLGVDYEVLGYIESGGIHHIDCWAKFLDPQTILVKDVPTGSSSYALLNARAAYLSQLMGPWGKPYTVIRVYCPYGTAYTNSLILNKKVFVPTFGDAYDDDALQIYADAMPGYQILGFDGSWLDDDAIHCRTMGVPDPDMLYIRHVPLSTQSADTGYYEVSAIIFPYSGALLTADSLKVYYQNRGQYESVPLVATAVPDSFVAQIPAQTFGSTINYYLKAADQAGKVETMPYIGQAWAYTFNVNSPPEIISPDYYLCVPGYDFAFAPVCDDLDDTVLTITYSDYPAWLSVDGDSLVGTVPVGPTQYTFTVTVADPFVNTSQEVTLDVFACGDANGDGDVNVADGIYIINFIFKSGPAPVPMEAADANGDLSVGVGDAVYIINYIFKSGPAPLCP